MPSMSSYATTLTAEEDTSPGGAPISHPPSRLLLTLVVALVCICSCTATLAFSAGFNYGLSTARPPELSAGMTSAASADHGNAARTSSHDTDGLTLLVEVQKEQHGFAALLPKVLKLREQHKQHSEGKRQLPKGWPCRLGESLFLNMCYVDCDEASQGRFPFRDDPCTCCASYPCEKRPMGYVQDCVRLDKGSDGLDAVGPRLTNCRGETEELFDGLCYLKCEILTAKMYPTRTGMNTCSNEMFGGNWIMGVGPCSGFGVGGTECMPHIPLPTGLGIASKTPVAQQDVGVPPMGIKVMPDVSDVSELLARS